MCSCLRRSSSLRLGLPLYPVPLPRQRSELGFCFQKIIIGKLSVQGAEMSCVTPLLAGGILLRVRCVLGKPRLGDERPPHPSCLVQPCRLPQASSAASVQVSNQERSYQESFRVEREQAERTRTCTAQDQFAKEVSHQDVCGDRRGGILRQGRGGGQAVRDLPQRLSRVPLQRERDLAHLRSGRGEDDRALCKLFRSRPSRCGRDIPG